MLFILLLILSAIFIFAVRQKTRLLHFGTFRFAKTITHNQQRFYLEEVAFDNRQQAIHGYFQLADRKSTRLNSSHLKLSRMPSSA